MIESWKKKLAQTFKRRHIAILMTSVVVFVATTGVLLYHGTKKTVALTLDGEEKTVKTHAKTIEELLEELDIALAEEDYLHPSSSTKLTDELKVKWEPAKEVTIIDNGIEKEVKTTAGTVEDLFKEQEIQIREEDKVSAEMTATISNNMDIAIDRAFLLKVVDGGKTKETWSTSTTVADFLEKQGIHVQPLDRVEPALTETIKENSVVNVVRVKKVTDVVEEPIDFAVVSKKDANLPKGTEKVVTEGSEGLVSNEYEVITENGKEVKRTLIKKTVVKEKQDKVIAVGNKAVTQTVSRGSSQAASSKAESSKSSSNKSNAAASSSGREMYVTATAYTAGCNGCSGITATGYNLKNNPNAKVIAVDPSVIPLGSKVYVDGYGYAIAADTGSSIKGNKIDVFFSNKSKAYQWGNRKVKIKVIK
ncbi:MAG: ubiquitin-like domain-containing protein [Bacillus sp. (in: firmicutes)]